MRLYVAGNVKNDGGTEDYGTGVRNRLLSYFFLENWAVNDFAYWVDRKPGDAAVLMDSGAFSAWRQGTPVDLDKYCAYLETVKHKLAGYIVLDVIKDLAGTKRNLADMRRRGLDPLPVYHSDCEPLSEWETILKENTGYVCLGGLAVSRPGMDDLQFRLNKCWRMVEKFWPVKVHALGVTTPWMLEQYPFYSADSASAIMGAGMGRVWRYGSRHEGYHPARGDKLMAYGWKDDVRLTYDGVVADNVGRVGGSAHAGRRLRNLQAQLELERYLTKLWETRGVSWAA